jgi:acyl-CoA synthetase (AMP-forming)/AMP-acid ligase II
VTKDKKSLKLEDVEKFCKGKISNIKIPKIISLIDSIPRNANGKVLKTELRKKTDD